MSRDQDHADAARIATEAGGLLMSLRASADTEGMEGKRLGKEGDRRSAELIARRLRETHPDDAILSEEDADDPARLRSARTWIVDPLDGTREFGEPGRWDWAVHVALVEDGIPVVAAVALPARSMTLSTEMAFPELPPGNDPPRVVVSRTRPPDVAEAVRAAVGGELVALGSAGAKTMAVVLGEADVYVHAGGQWEWDSAAPVGVAAAAGLHVSRLDGSPLRYNQQNPWLPDLLICRPELAEAALTAAAAAPPTRSEP